METTTNPDKSTASPSGGMDLFFTSATASEGVRMPLYDPLGRKTEHWLHIIGSDSEEFRIADSAAKRRAVELGNLTTERERDEAVLSLTRELTAVLVKDWSFDRPCTLENVVEFFRQAPQIQRSVNTSAVNRALFYKVASKS